MASGIQGRMYVAVAFTVGRLICDRAVQRVSLSQIVSRWHLIPDYLEPVGAKCNSTTTRCSLRAHVDQLWGPRHDCRACCGLITLSFRISGTTINRLIHD